MKRIKQIVSFVLIISLLLDGLLVTSSKTVEAKMKKYTYYVGDTAILYVTNVKRSRVRWKSFNSRIVSVSKRGKLKAKRAGTAKVQGKCGKRKYTVKIVVKNRKKYRSTTTPTTSYDTPRWTPRPKAVQTPKPTPVQTPTPTKNPTPQGKDFSFSVKLLKSGDVLVTVTNKSDKFVKGAELTIKCYNSNGTYLDETYAKAKYLKANGGTAYDVLSYWYFPSGTDYSKCRATVKVDYDGVSVDMSSSITPNIYIDDDINISLKNNSSMYTAYFSPTIFYYDSAGNLVAAEHGAGSYSTFEITPGATFEEAFVKPRSAYTGESIDFKKAEIRYTAGTIQCS